MYPIIIVRLIRFFILNIFADKDNLITPMKPLLLESDENGGALFCKDF